MSESLPKSGDLLLVQVCDFGDDGDASYRQHEPSRYLSREAGVVVVDCHYYHRHLPALLNVADVVVLQFVNDWDLFSVIEERRAKGQVTVFEANDYFFDIQPWNPISAAWLERATQEAYRNFLRHADAVQTSSEQLARHWRVEARAVAIFPNQLTSAPGLSPSIDRPLTIGWGGSPGHFADWYHVAPLLQRWLDEHTDVHLAVMTHEFARGFFRLAPARYHFTPFGSLTDYLTFLESLDIGLAPLLPTEYNRCRSDVKYLEYASRGVAGIYAELEPYRGTVVPGETGMLFGTLSELGHCLDRMSADARLRQRIRQQAHAEVTSRRSLGDHVGRRLDFYRKLLPAGSQPGRLSPEIVASSESDGAYFRLRPQAAEKRLLGALRSAASRDAVQDLSELVEEHPNYLAALQHLGRLLNDLGEHRRALHYLERAHRINPGSARTLCEIGRARFAVESPTSARATLDAALKVNPLYYPGWHYLFRLLALQKSPDGPRWLELARRRFPGDFALALAGVPLEGPGRGVLLLCELLEKHAPGLTPEERPAAAATFSRAILDLLRTAKLSPAVLDLLRRGCELFPDSVALATALGQALHGSGQEEESQLHYARALRIARTAALFQQEGLREDGNRFYWQFGEHFRRTAGLE
jgi:tetratricopeptide (TPR) repeat protein